MNTANSAPIDPTVLAALPSNPVSFDPLFNISGLENLKIKVSTEMLLSVFQADLVLKCKNIMNVNPPKSLTTPE
ncbi:hypothetical protein ACFX13_028500 [Malus domestica]